MNIYGAKTIFVTIKFYLKLPISEFTCRPIPQVYTNTELTLQVIVTQIISSYKYSPVLYQQKKDTLLSKLPFAKFINLKILSTYSLKRIKICSFPELSWYVRIYSCTVTLPTSKV